MKLLLIRHGQTVDNVNGALGTQVPGPGLTALGSTQAAAIPNALRNTRIDAIYISTMLRTRKTAEPLAADRDLPLVVIPGIHEIRAGELEDRTDGEAIDLYRGTIFAWWTDLSARLPGGESGEEFVERFGRAVREIADRWSGDSAACVAIFSHGAAIRAWVLAASHNVDPEYSRQHPLDNTAVIELEGSDEGGWTVTAWAGEPLGGSKLQDAHASDPTGDAQP